jgi:hypothetical protein
MLQVIIFKEPKINWLAQKLFQINVHQQIHIYTKNPPTLTTSTWQVAETTSTVEFFRNW